MKKTVSGFSLLELMIAVVIIGILAAIAIPSYTAHLKKVRRAEAMSLLTDCGHTMERQYTATYDYTDLAACPVASSDYYTIAIQSSTRNTYTLRATPVLGTSQATDGIIELLSTGLQRWDEHNTPGTWEADENDWHPG